MNFIHECPLLSCVDISAERADIATLIAAKEKICITTVVLRSRSSRKEV